MPWSLARITQLAPASAFGWLFTPPCVKPKAMALRSSF